MFSCDQCDKKFTTNSNLKKHKMIHLNDDEITWFKCNKCKYKSFIKRNLKNHQLTHKEENEITWFICDFKECGKKCKTKDKLKSHQLTHKEEHEITWFVCDFKECGKKCKTNGDLTKHKVIHQDNETIYRFKCNKCNKTFKYGSVLKNHMIVHESVENITWFYCSIQECDKKFSSYRGLKNHESRHKTPEEVNKHICGIEKCNKKFKTNYELIRHVSQVHDIGKYQCQICLGNKNSRIKWKDQNNINLEICRDCFKKATGKESRVEVQMSDFLDTIEEIKPFLVGTDDSFKKLGGCSLKRPDKLYISSDLVLWIECDENQHKYFNGDYSCDEKRISDSLDEFSLKKLAVIRWNPDSYKIPEDLNVSKRDKKERLNLLKDQILEILDKPPENLVNIYYMFYDEDNPMLCKNIEYELIY